MVRFVIFAGFIVCLGLPGVFAEDSRPALIIAADHNLVPTLPAMPSETELVVLLEDLDDIETTFEAINLRALQFRHASHFFYQSGREPSYLPIVRERLRNHGVILVDLRTPGPGSQSKQRRLNRLPLELIRHSERY
ncbi:MAG: hypothetical protein AAF539_06395 [Planctomycetota bacterium]